MSHETIILVIPGEKGVIVFEEIDVEVDGAAEDSREVGNLSYVVDYLGKLYVYLQEKLYL